MASLNNQSAFSHVFNLFIIESAFCSVLIVFARISLSITESLWNNYRKHSLFSWYGINVLMFVFKFHPGTPVIFVFNCFWFIIFFHILPSFIPPHLRYPCLHTSFTSFEQIYSLLDANSQFSIGQETEYNKAINFCYFARLQWLIFVSK